jgi:lysosomal alpha-mannosidase
MEVVWQGSANLDNTNIFTVVFPDGYGPLGGYCYDIQCGDTVFNDDESSPDYNVPQIVGAFQERLDQLITYYRTNNIIIPMGTDFQFQSAEKNFINMDRMIAGFKDNDRYNVIYSTPSCYIKAVNEAAAAQDVEFTVKTDDYFPYASDTHTYWAGYFTSRPNLKRNERLGNNLLQAAKQLASFSKVNGVDHDQDLSYLKRVMGILQHHDAITGTSKENVAQDYIRLWANGVKKAEPTFSVITDLLKKDASADINLNLETCLLANVSICEPARSDRFAVTIYNPLERPVTHYVRIPVPDGSYKITGPDGEIQSDLLDSISSFDYVDDDIGSTNPKELVFAASDLPGFGVKLYYVEKTASKSEPIKSTPKLKFGTDETGFEIDDQTGLLKSVTMNGQTVDITQQFFYYNGFNGDNNGADNQASGAYIFRPIENSSTVVGDTVSVTSTSGNLVDEVRQQVNDWVTQIIRVYKGGNDNYIEFDWLVGPIEVDTDNGIGREIVSRFTINDFDNADTFYTDANGRELLKRQLNKRYDYEYDSTLEPIASNYYPITSKIVLKDENKNLEVALLNDRAQGGSSLESGQVEIMVHRRLLVDDAKGVGEGLDDYEFDQGVVARGQLYLVVGSASSDGGDGKSTAAQERELALKKLLAPLVLVADASSDDLSLDNVQTNFNFNFEGLKATLPDNVHIVTLEPWQDDSFILRLEHILEKNEDDNLSQSVTVDLTGLFSLFDITEIRETALAANRWLDELQAKEKYVWNVKGGGKASNNRSTPAVKADELQISLEPMQIRTFVIKVSKTH